MGRISNFKVNNEDVYELLLKDKFFWGFACSVYAWHFWIKFRDISKSTVMLFLRGLGYLPGGHLPPPKFGHLPPPNSVISHPQKKTFARRTTATPNFFFFFCRTFLGFFDLQLMEDIKDGKEEVLDEVVMEHIK